MHGIQPQLRQVTGPELYEILGRVGIRLELEASMDASDRTTPERASAGLLKIIDELLPEPVFLPSVQSYLDLGYSLYPKRLHDKLLPPSLVFPLHFPNLDSDQAIEASQPPTTDIFCDYESIEGVHPCRTREMLFPVKQQVAFDDVRMSVPARPHQVMRQTFGSTWTVKIIKGYKGYYCSTNPDITLLVAIAVFSYAVLLLRTSPLASLGHRISQRFRTGSLLPMRVPSRPAPAAQPFQLELQDEFDDDADDSMEHQRLIRIDSRFKNN